jgi:hypothetical protein
VIGGRYSGPNCQGVYSWTGELPLRGNYRTCTRSFQFPLVLFMRFALSCSRLMLNVDGNICGRTVMLID